MGLCFLQASEREFDACSLDKLTVRYIEEYLERQGVAQINLQALFPIQPQTLEYAKSTDISSCSIKDSTDMIIKSLLKYKCKLLAQISSREDNDPKDHLVAKKYSERDCIEQIEAFIGRLQTLSLPSIKDLMNPEDDRPESVRFPAICLDLVIENPFIFDLIKSETFDWETNYHLYKQSKTTGNADLGYLAGLLSQYIKKACTPNSETKIPHKCCSPISMAYFPGLMNQTFLDRLLIQRDQTSDSFYDDLLFPGISVCFETYEDSLDYLGAGNTQHKCA